MISEPTMRRCETSTPKKGCEIAFLRRDLLKISIWNSLWISLLVIGDHKAYNNLRVGTIDKKNYGFQKGQWECPILTSVKIWLNIDFSMKDKK